jgi:hypothetical protein
LEVDLAALARLSPELHALAARLKASAGAAWMGAPGDPEADTPSLVAARSISTETIPGLQTTVADRFVEVGELVDQARTQFKNCDSDLRAVITGAGSLRPPPTPPGG